MNCLLVEPDYKTDFPPLGLMRISSMLKSQGHNVIFVKGIQKIDFVPDSIYITSLFTYQFPETIKTIKYYTQEFPFAKSYLGGILASTRPDLFENSKLSEIHIGIYEEAEKFPPDYSLFPDMDYSLTFASKGCCNKCPFCVVPEMEGKIHPRDWIKDINPKFKKIVFFDNNWLALPKERWEGDVKHLHNLVKLGVTNIDFNQSLDCRKFTEDKAKLMKGLPINPFRLSFDHIGQDKHFQKAVKLAKEYGFTNIRVDVLYNWMDSPEDFYYRLKETTMAVNGTGGCAVLMKYAPLNKIERDYVGPKWTKKEVDAVRKLNPYPYGQVSSKSLKEFEYFFGKTAKEFKKMLNYPNIKKLTVLKRNKFNKDRVQKKVLQNANV